ncbi:MAG: alpha/beta hydrolase [Candidatus Levybacteria bacterium]|nr:alpha/beta hydrolase [Candidatus Levybacteria bacterium]
MKKNPVIILHGWGLHGGAYHQLIKLLTGKGHRVYAPDLPGFGSEPLVNKIMTLDDYVNFLHFFIKKHKITSPVIIGHSFGGRVAIKYCWQIPQEVSKLIITGVPVIRRDTIKMKLAYIMAVVGGLVLKTFPLKVQQAMRKLLYRLIGEWDYYRAGPLKQVFKNIISEQLIEYVKNLQVPVILVWGREDRITPCSDVEKIKRLIPGARSVIIPNTGHKLPYLNPGKFFEAIQIEL